MESTFYPYLPKHIVLRRYDDVNIYDLKNDESYIIDNEAYSVLKLCDGQKSINDIANEFPEDKREEVKEALSSFNELGVSINSTSMIEDNSVKSLEHQKLLEKNMFNPPYLKNLMINITEKCNLTCKHCYITHKNPIDIPFDKLTEVIKQFYEYQGIRLIMTGGEPFLYSKLRELLIFLKAVPLQKVFLTNGLLIEENQEILDLLQANFCEIYVSLDGLEKTHNDFRNADCFQDTIKGIKILLENDISVSINTMVHKQNLQEFDEIFRLLNSLGKIKNWSIDIPTFDETTPKSIREKYEITPEEGGQILKDYGWGVIFESYSESDDTGYACGPHLMAIDVLGVVTKCGFFTEQSVGNIFELGLKESWILIQKNLNWNICDLECKKINCEVIDDCRGGCRYRGYKNSGSILGVDAFKCSQFEKLKNQNN